MTSDICSAADLVLAIVGRERSQPGPLLPILHAVQEAIGFIPADAVEVIARELNLSRAEVHGVVTFYRDFRQYPAGRHVVKMCKAEACQAMGGDELIARVERHVGVPLGHTSADGGVTLEPAYCLGLCAMAPSAMVDNKPVGRLSEAKIDALLKGLEA